MTNPATAPTPAASVSTGVPSGTISTTFAHEAHQYLQRGDAQAAITLCTQGLSIYPQYVTAYLILARALLSVGDYLAAERAIEQGIKIAPRLTGLGSSFGSLRKQFLAAKAKPAPLLVTVAAPTTTHTESTTPATTRDTTNAAPEAALEHSTYTPSSVEVAAQEAASALREVEEIVVTQEQELVEASSEFSGEHTSEFSGEAATNAPFPTSSWRIVEEEPAFPVFDVEQQNERSSAPTNEQLDAANAASELASSHAISFDHDHALTSSVAAVVANAEKTIEGTLGNTLRLIETTRPDAPAHSTLRSNNLRLIPGLEFTSLRIESGFSSNTRLLRGTREAGSQSAQRDARGAFARTSVLPDLPEPQLDTNIAWDDDDEMPPSEETTRRPRLDHPQQFGLSAIARYRISDIEQSYPHVQAEHDAISEDLDNLATLLSKAQMPSVEELSERDDIALPAGLTDETAQASAPEATVIASETMAKIYEMQGAMEQALHAYRLLLDAAHDDDKRAAFKRKVEHLQAAIEARQEAEQP
jgi:tetratricopeptide (TPR) repeat protein